MLGPHGLIHIFFRCPSFEFQTDENKKSDIVVSSTCVFDSATSTSVWGPASPNNVIDASGTVIESAAANPTPGCGCKDLVLAGEVPDEDGKVFKCTVEPTINADGNTVITQENDCALLCDGTLVFDLYCSVGQWSVDYLTTASDIYCYGGGTTVDGGLVTLSTFWPPAPTDKPDTTPAPVDDTTPAPVDDTTPAPVDDTTPAVEN